MVRADEVTTQRLVEVEVEVPNVLLVERPATAPTQVDSLNSNLGIMDVVQAVNEEAEDEVNTPAPAIADSDRALAAQFNSKLEEPLARVEELEATQTLNEED